VEWDTYHHLEEERAKFGYMSVSQTGILLCSGDSSGTQCLNMAIFDFLFSFPPLIYDDFSFALLSPKKTLFILRRGILFYFIFCGCNGGAKFRPPQKNQKQWVPVFFLRSLHSFIFFLSDGPIKLACAPHKKKIEKSN